MTIGDRLRQARKDAGLTQAKLARLSGVNQARISGLETGTQEQSVYLVELALGLGVDAAWLQTGVSTTKIKAAYTVIEKEIISLLRQLTDEQRVREIAYLERLVADNSKLAER